MNIKKFLRNIFSVKNEHFHKVLCIFGIKLKFKRKVSLSLFEEYLNIFVDIRLAPKARGKLRKMQLLELYLMRELKNICERIGVKFWLRGGTALGAYRHKGFIPWDDDVDLGVMREDFDKLVDYVNSNSDKFEILYFYHHTCKIAKFTFKNVEGGIFVDLFPFDWCSYDDHKDFWAKWLSDKQKLREELKKYKPFYNDGSYSHEIQPELLESIEKTNDKYKNMYNKFSDRSAICSAIEQLGARKRKRIFPYEMIFPLKKVVFEDDEYYVMNNLEGYLKSYYGKNYMKFPMLKDLANHDYMFSIDNKEEIEMLYEKYIIGEQV